MATRHEHRIRHQECLDLESRFGRFLPCAPGPGWADRAPLPANGVRARPPLRPWRWLGGALDAAGLRRDGVRRR